MLSEIHSKYKNCDTQMQDEAKNEIWTQPVYAPTPKDRLIVAIVSLVILICCAVFMFGAITVFHAGIIGWLATFVVILFSVITINVVMALNSSHLKSCNEQPGV